MQSVSVSFVFQIKHFWFFFLPGHSPSNRFLFPFKMTRFIDDVPDSIFRQMPFFFSCRLDNKAISPAASRPPFPRWMWIALTSAGSDLLPRERETIQQDWGKKCAETKTSSSPDWLLLIEMLNYGKHVCAANLEGCVVLFLFTKPIIEGTVKAVLCWPPTDWNRRVFRRNELSGFRVMRSAISPLYDIVYVGNW